MLGGADRANLANRPSIFMPSPNLLMFSINLNGTMRLCDHKPFGYLERVPVAEDFCWHGFRSGHWNDDMAYPPACAVGLVLV